jgi:hypothetical protein
MCVSGNITPRLCCANLRCLKGTPPIGCHGHVNWLDVQDGLDFALSWGNEWTAKRGRVMQRGNFCLPKQIAS